MNSELALDEADLIQSVCRESFFEFLKEFWGVLIPEDPVWNWHIPYLCGELQRMAERVFRGENKEHDVIVNIPPGTTKSTVCSIMFPAWVWTRMPTARILGATYDHLLSLGFSRKSRDLITCAKYQQAFRFKKNTAGRWVPSTDDDAVPITLREDQNTKGLYENQMKGVRQAVGTGGNITGYHFHIILLDDLLNPKQAVSIAGLAEANHFMSETLPSRKVNKAVTPTVLIMQRLNEDDPTGHWLEKKKEGIKHICLPAELSELVKPARLKLKYEAQGGFLDPIRLNRDVLDEQLLELGSYGYSGQYEQSPAPQGGGLFEVENIRVGTPPVRKDFVKIVRYWDKAATEGSKAAKAGVGAETAGVCMGVDIHRRIWVLDVEHGRWSVTKRNMTMKQVAEMDGFEVQVGVEVEPGSGGKESGENTVIDVLPGYRVVLHHPTGDKVTRAEPFAGQVGIGNVYVPKDAPWWQEYKAQLKNFPVGKRKDMVDASSGAHQMLRGAKPRVGALFSRNPG